MKHFYWVIQPDSFWLKCRVGQLVDPHYNMTDPDLIGIMCLSVFGGTLTELWMFSGRFSLGLSSLTALPRIKIGNLKKINTCFFATYGFFLFPVLAVGF